MCLLASQAPLPAITTLSQYLPSWPSTASPRISGHFFEAFNFSLLEIFTKGFFVPCCLSISQHDLFGHQMKNADQVMSK